MNLTKAACPESRRSSQSSLITRKHGQNIQTVHSAKIMVPNKCMKNGHRGNANKRATTHDHASSELRPDPAHVGGAGELEGLCAAGGDTAA